MKIPGHLRTIRTKRDYCGHDFVEHELCLTCRDGVYYLEHWIDPMPGGQRTPERFGHCALLPIDGLLRLVPQ